MLQSIISSLHHHAISLFLITTVADTHSAGSHNNVLQMIREEDKLQPLSEERFTRVQRALDGRNVGVQEKHLSTAPAASISKPNKWNNRRRGVIFVDDADEMTEVEYEHEEIMAQNNIRHAQDTLLLHQLDSGVIPERFIKVGIDGEDPLHVSVVLSKYGIGDARGICLGKW